jgi:hypothetical protein
MEGIAEEWNSSKNRYFSVNAFSGFSVNARKSIAGPKVTRI